MKKLERDIKKIEKGIKLTQDIVRLLIEKEANNKYNTTKDLLRLVIFYNFDTKLNEKLSILIDNDFEEEVLFSYEQINKNKALLRDFVINEFVERGETPQILEIFELMQEYEYAFEYIAEIFSDFELLKKEVELCALLKEMDKKDWQELKMTAKANYVMAFAQA